MEFPERQGKLIFREPTHELVKDFFDFEFRGKIPVKHKGDVDMYFVKGIKKELSMDGKGELPNTSFNTKLQLLRYDDWKN